MARAAGPHSLVVALDFLQVNFRDNEIVHGLTDICSVYRRHFDRFILQSPYILQMVSMLEAVLLIVVNLHG